MYDDMGGPYIPPPRVFSRPGRGLRGQHGQGSGIHPRSISSSPSPNHLSLLLPVPVLIQTVGFSCL